MYLILFGTLSGSVAVKVPRTVPTIAPSFSRMTLTLGVKTGASFESNTVIKTVTLGDATVLSILSFLVSHEKYGSSFSTVIISVFVGVPSKSKGWRKKKRVIGL